MKILAVAQLLLALVVASPSPTSTPSMAPVTPQSALTRVLTAKSVSPDWFDSTFLVQVPASQIDTILAQIRTPLGEFKSLSAGKDGAFTATFANGTMLCNIVLDSDGKISGLFFHPPLLNAASLSDAAARIRALSGTSSYVVIRNGREIASAGQDRALSVGSTFKLAVLAALNDAIERHRMHWNEVVALRSEWRSLPSGILQKWPVGSALTLQTLATLMISQSDNTAADTLVHVVGRPAIVPYAGGNDPFLTTHDLFVLKSKGQSALRTAWRTGNLTQRRALVARLDAMPIPAASDLDTSPAYSDIEWHYTNRELCALMAHVQSLALTSVNPGIGDASDWKRVSYKGGSDFGVISMTTWLVAPDGTNYCVSATLNSTTDAVDQTAFETAFDGVIGFLAKQR